MIEFNFYLIFQILFQWNADDNMFRERADVGN